MLEFQALINLTPSSDAQVKCALLKSLLSFQLFINDATQKSKGVYIFFKSCCMWFITGD